MNDILPESELSRDGLVKFLYQKHHEALLFFTVGWCKRFGFDVSYADDLLQEFYEAVLNNHTKIARGYSLHGIKFLFQVIKYDLLDLNRSKKSKERVEQIYALGIDATSDIHYLCAEEFHQQFFEQLKRLLSEEDCVVMSLYLQGYSYEEIGRKIKMNTNTVGVRIHRAKRTLQKHIVQ